MKEEEKSLTVPYFLLCSSLEKEKTKRCTLKTLPLMDEC
jgi:hypothetical protein